MSQQLKDVVLKIGLPAVILLAFALNFQNCGSDLTPQKREAVEALASNERELLALKEEITQKVSLDCDTSSDCRAIGFGSRSCGGPDSILVYSIKSMNNEDFISEVENYNQLEKIFKERQGVVSICSVIIVPEQEDLVCQSDLCSVNSNP